MLLWIVLFGIGYRLLVFALHNPLLGYANNYDMIRIQACHSIWPAGLSIQEGTSTIAAPLERYVRNTENPIGTCYPSSELVFTQLMAWMLGDKSEFSIRTLALFKLAITGILLGVMLIAIFALSPGVALLSAGVLFVLLPDPFNALYLPTFYAEWSALSGFLLTALALVLVSLRPRGYFSLLAFFFAVVLWGLSKTQHVIAPVLAMAGLLPLFVFGHRRACLPALVSAFAATLVVLVVQAYWLSDERNQSVKMANATNTYLHTVLAASEQPRKLATRLGLPPDCAESAGLSWYSAELHENGHPCPEVFELARYRLLLLPFFDIHSLFQMFGKSGEHLRQVYPDYLGQVAGQDSGHARDYLTSIFGLMERVPSHWVLPFAALLSTVSLVVGLRNSWQSRVNEALLLPLSCLSVFLGIATPTIYLVALFGDGYIDLAKHSHLAFNGLMLLCLGWCGFLLTYIWARLLKVSDPA